MDSIETKINMLYDFIYSNEYKGEIKETKLDINNISMDDIKYKYEGENYDDVLTELLSGKFRMIDYIKDTNTLILKRYTAGLSISLYI